MTFLTIWYGMIILALEIPHLWKKAPRRELYIFLIFFSVGFTLLLLVSLRVKLPNPNRYIEMVFKPLGIWLGLEKG